MWGDLLAASPMIRELSETAKSEHDEGLTEDQVRQRIRSRLQTEGLTVRAAVLPTLSRKMLRIKLRPLLHALAELLANKAQSKRFGDAIEPWFAKLGLDKWLEDFIWNYALTGEASPVYEVFSGKTFVQEFGKGDDKTPTVWLVASPASDVRALIEEFLDQCERTLPDDTMGKRYAETARGMRYFRLHQEGRSYTEIGREELQAERPDLSVDSDEFDELLRMRTEQVTKAASRSFARADRIFDFLSAESD